MPEDKNQIRLADPKKLLRQYQSGVVEDDTEPIGRVKPAPVSGANLETNMPEPEQEPFSYARYLRQNGVSNDIEADYTQEAKEAGYGLSKYDDDFAPGMDLEQNRALEQSGFAKIGSGLLKGGVTAATTAVNTTLGTIFGAGAAMYELAADANGNGRSLMDTLDAGTNNWISNQLMKIQSWAEEALPNYRTEQERSEKYQKEWYKHMGTANFIGDSILKNFGFTVGAMVGGMAWTRLIGAGLARQVANNVMKGAVVAAEGDAEVSALLQEASAALRSGAKTAEAQAAIGRAIEALERGAAVGVDTEKLLKNIEAAGRSINKMNAKLQLYGAAIGAMGEGTVEGIMAKNEFLDEYKQALQDKFTAKYNNAEKDILNSGNYDWISFDAQEGPDGQLDYTPRLTKAGMAELDRRQREAIEEYQQMSQFAEEQGDRLATTTFLLNLPILTTSNLIQFGRMFSGGWKTSRSALSGLKGGIKESAGKITADYAAKGSKAGKTILNSLKVAGSESFEEMAQGTVSSGAKRVAYSNLAEFNNAGYDAEAIGDARDWFYNMYTGGKEYLGDIKNWQEGALGAITGLFGIPGRRWSGGVVGAYQEANEEINARRSMANELNRRINTQKFQDDWHGYIRHQAADNKMERALNDDDEYAWHGANDEQLISDIIMFAKAGRLEDLNQIVSAYAEMSGEDVKGLRDVLSDGKHGTDWTENLTDEEVVGKVKEQAKDIKDKIKEYKDVYEAIKARAPIGASDKFIDEMTYTALMVKSFDQRFMQMLGETMEAIDPILLASSARDEEGKPLNEDDSSAKYKQLLSAYERLFAGSLLPVGIKQQMIDALNFEQLARIVKDDPELKKKVNDMQRLSEERKQTFLKLQTLQEPGGQKKFEKEAITQDDVDQAAEEAQAREETSGLDSLLAVKQAYFSKDANGRADFLSTIESIEESNPAVKEFMALKRKVDGFKAFIESRKKDIASKIAMMPNVVDSAVDDFLRKAKTEEDLMTLPDSMFVTFDEFSRDNRTIFGSPSQAMHEGLKKELRDAMREYYGIETATASRSTVSPTPVTPDPAPGTVSDPDNTHDPAQPASVEPAPSAEGPAPAIQPESAAEEETAPEEAPVEYVEPEIEVLPPTDRPVPEDIAEEAMDAIQETPEVPSTKDLIEEQDAKGQITYLRTSAPEVATAEAKKGRMAKRTGDREMMKTVDLSDFLEYLDHKIAEVKEQISDLNGEIREASGRQKSELRKEKKQLEESLAKYEKDRKGWEATINALKERNAFENVVKVLEVGDEIEFVVDPTFPEYNGHYQILTTVVKNGQRYVLNILSAQTELYRGLYELRKAIDEEYQKHIKENPNTEFVFSKKSRVFMKRDGLVDYDYDRTAGSYSEEKGIQDIRGYDPEMPIVFINRNGDAVVVNGKDQSAVDGVGPDFNDSQANRDKGKRGNLYYLSSIGSGWYVPIRLWTEHFRKSNKDADNPVFDRIRKSLTTISGLVRSADAQNYKEKHSKMLEELKTLSELLNIGGYNFQIGDFGGSVGVALRIFPVGNENDNTYRRADQITADWLIDHIAGLGLSLQIKQDEEGNVPNLSQYVESGLITSNARMMRPKGMDFYFTSWDAKAGEFVPTEKQQEEFNWIDRDTTYEAPADEQNYEEGEPIETGIDDIGEADFGREDFGGFDEEYQSLEPATVAREGVDEQAEAVKEHKNEIYDKFIAPIMDDPGGDDVAKIVTIMASQGASVYSAVVQTLSSYQSEDTPIARRISDFGVLINHIFTAEEKMALSDAIRKKSGKENVSLYDLMIDYAKWRLDPHAGRSKESKIIASAFQRLDTVSNYKDIIQSALSPAYEYLDMKDNTFNPGKDFGFYPDLSLFSELPSSVKEALKEKGYTEDEYNAMAPALQDQALRCATIG